MRKPNKRQLIFLYAVLVVVSAVIGASTGNGALVVPLLLSSVLLFALVLYTIYKDLEDL